MIVASALVPSEKSTVILPFAVAASTTWLLVRMYPPCRITNPEPVPVPEEPSTLIVTTLGRTLDAMSAMDPCGRTVEEAGAGGNDAEPPSPRLTRNAPATPPKRAATMAIASAPTRMTAIAPAPRPRKPVRSAEWAVTGLAATDGLSTGGALRCRNGLPVGGGSPPIGWV